MNTKLVIGVSLLLFLGYLLFRRMLAHNSLLAEYRREVRDIITNEKYQVKGKFD